MISFFQGNSVDMTVNIVLQNAPYDVTNDLVWFTIKTNFADSDSNALLQVTTETTNGAITFLDAPNGNIIVSLTPTNTQNLPTGEQLHCDVQIRTPAGKVYTVYIDTVVVNSKVTDSLSY